MAGKKIEVDESEWAAMTGVAGVVQGMLNNPEARTLVLKARKIVDPKAPIPEIDAAAPVMGMIEQTNKTVAELAESIKKDREEREAAARKADTEARWSSGRKLARDAGYLDDGLKKLEDFMEKRGIFDHEIAIPAFEALHPAPPAPISDGVGLIGNSFDVFSPVKSDEGAIKKLFESRGDDPAATNELINSALADARGVSRI